MTGVAVTGNEKKFGITQRNADARGKTRAYESELHPLQPTYDISVN